jgi:hypothetical protein
MSSAAVPGNLKLVLEHLNAVRELDRYLRKKGVDKDLDRYIKEAFCPALQERIPTLKLWHCDSGESCAEWYPDSWQVKGDLYLSISVLIPSPLDPDDANPSVNLYVPKDWPGHPSFSDRSTPCVKTLLGGGFALAVDHDWDEEYPVGKYVNWLEPDDSFDESKLVERIASEVAKVVQVAPEIAEVIGAASTKPAPKASISRRR